MVALEQLVPMNIELPVGLEFQIDLRDRCIKNCGVTENLNEITNREFCLKVTPVYFHIKEIIICVVMFTKTKSISWQWRLKD